MVPASGDLEAKTTWRSSGALLLSVLWLLNLKQDGWNQDVLPLKKCREWRSGHHHCWSLDGVKSREALFSSAEAQEIFLKTPELCCIKPKTAALGSRIIAQAHWHTQTHRRARTHCTINDTQVYLQASSWSVFLSGEDNSLCPVSIPSELKTHFTA